MKTRSEDLQNLGELKRRQYADLGWCAFDYDPFLHRWVQHAEPVAREELAEEKSSDWIRCNGTWYVGVNALNNDETGRLKQGPPFSSEAIRFISETFGFDDIVWDRAQISVCYPGYPQRSADEADSAYNYRLRRDAAHVDGLLPEGPTRRRHLREHHSFVLGIPMMEHSEASSPLVMWEGSHHIVREKFGAFYKEFPPNEWGNQDVTELYNETRKTIFEQCKRVVIMGRPGETYLLHRLTLHGIAPWKEKGQNDPYRMVCYFRPELSSPEDWLFQP
ncbi:MAG: hypothetical protein GKR95_14540 [Gammaproteobacteria bacterium]|nr:hypothetical protein [Gammaproteobacteria bacterium]